MAKKHNLRAKADLQAHLKNQATQSQELISTWRAIKDSIEQQLNSNTQDLSEQCSRYLNAKKHFFQQQKASLTKQKRNYKPSLWKEVQKEFDDTCMQALVPIPEIENMPVIELKHGHKARQQYFQNEKLIAAWQDLRAAFMNTPLNKRIIMAALLQFTVIRDAIIDSEHGRLTLHIEDGLNERFPIPDVDEQIMAELLTFAHEMQLRHFVRPEAVHFDYMSAHATLNLLIEGIIRIENKSDAEDTELKLQLDQWVKKPISAEVTALMHDSFDYLSLFQTIQPEHVKNQNHLGLFTAMFLSTEHVDYAPKIADFADTDFEQLECVYSEWETFSELNSQFHETHKALHDILFKIHVQLDEQYNQILDEADTEQKHEKLSALEYLSQQFFIHHNRNEFDRICKNLDEGECFRYGKALQELTQQALELFPEFNTLESQRAAKARALIDVIYNAIPDKNSYKYQHLCKALNVMSPFSHADNGLPIHKYIDIIASEKSLLLDFDDVEPGQRAEFLNDIKPDESYDEEIYIDWSIDYIKQLSNYILRHSYPDLKHNAISETTQIWMLLFRNLIGDEKTNPHDTSPLARMVAIIETSLQTVKNKGLLHNIVVNAMKQIPQMQAVVTLNEKMKNDELMRHLRTFKQSPHYKCYSENHFTNINKYQTKQQFFAARSAHYKTKYEKMDKLLSNTKATAEAAKSLSASGELFLRRAASVSHILPTMQFNKVSQMQRRREYYRKHYQYEMMSQHYAEKIHRLTAQIEERIESIPYQAIKGYIEENLPHNNPEYEDDNSHDDKLSYLSANQILDTITTFWKHFFNSLRNLVKQHAPHPTLNKKLIFFSTASVQESSTQEDDVRGYQLEPFS